MAASAPRRDAIARTLREEILRGTYAPGDRLPGERDLAQRLGANRSSVREALRELEQNGLVHIRRGGGATVCELQRASLEVVRHLLFVDGRLNRALLEELLDVHELLIVGATRLALERASDAELAEARSLVARLGAPDTDDDGFIDGAAALLELIAAASRNGVLRRAREAVNPLFEPRYREVRKRFRPPAERLAPLVRGLDAALAARDATRAESLVRELLRANRSRALDAIQASLPTAPLETRAPDRRPT